MIEMTDMYFMIFFFFCQKIYFFLFIFELQKKIKLKIKLQIKVYFCDHIDVNWKIIFKKMNNIFTKFLNKNSLIKNYFKYIF